MSGKKRVAVLMGGMSCEREISLKTGARVHAALDPTKYDLQAVQISESGLWSFDGGPGLPLGEALTRLGGPQGAEVAFIALHGTFGEDGAVQGLLEWAGIPYTGSGILGSALAMDKERSRDILREQGVPVPRTFALGSSDWTRERGRCESGISTCCGSWPVVVKPVAQGSSAGVHIVRDPDELAAAVEDALRFEGRVLVEEYLRGDEATCAVLGTPGGGEPIALPPTQIIPKTAEFFDFEAKYTPGATEEITPARFPAETIRRIQENALRVHRALLLGGMSRTDFIVSRGVPYALEANTIPGMTDTSLLPQAARAVGIEFPALLDRILVLAIEDHARRRT